MSNLIKAELYRLRHSNRLLFSLIGLCIMGILTSFLNDFLDINRQSFAAGGAPMGIVFSLMGIGVAIGIHYQNRTAFYEIMDGVSAHKTILSRMCVYTPIMICAYFIPVSAVLMIKDGGSGIALFLLMLLIIFLRLTIFTICGCLIFKSGEGGILPFARFILEMLPTMLMSQEELDISSEKVMSALNWFPIFQVYSLAGEIDGTLIMKIIAGFVAEAAVMYALAYTSHRKKWLIKFLFT